MFTRRHFIAVADVIHEQYVRPPEYQDLNELIEAMAHLFRESNPRFDRDKFIHRCLHGSAK